MKILITSFLIWISISCQAKKDDLLSESKYAYRAPSKNVGNLFNLYLFTRSENLNFQKTLPVCIERTGNEPFDRSLYVEVQIAYFKWFSRVSNFSEEAWKVFDFYLADACDFNSAEFASKILIIKEPYVASVEDGADFKKAEAICEKIELFSCKSHSAPVGLGSGAALMYNFYPSMPDIWTKIAITAPAKVHLSPFVNWVPLNTAITNFIPNLKAARKEGFEKEADVLGFLQMYNSATESHSLSFETISKLSDALDGLGLIYNLADPELKRILTDFKSRREKNFKKEFKLTIPTLSILLHEVGHQFGMSHADAPGPDDVTGQSEQAHLNKAGQWICKESRMSYGENFLYLTQDDLMGAESLFLASREFVNSVTMH